jgi:hypothetical protein
VIDIDEKLYERITVEKEYFLEDGEDLCSAIENGVPIPTGHGRLIDADRLKREIENDKDREMADILVSAMPLKEDVIQEVIGLTDEQNKVLKKAAGRRYITINAFPELVKDNFDTIKNLGVKDPIGIFINHPTRFTMNPSNFKDVLDKYDEEDLIRCLDKNGAVIDKL